MFNHEPPRYTRFVLPDYRHVPGRTPHPTPDPLGHSFGRKTGPLPDLNVVDWHLCGEYLVGVDLFNNDFWWESHEIFEGLWHAAGHATPAGHVLQAVIQCAAAHLKAEADSMAAASRLFEHSLGHFNWAGPLALGLNLEALVRDTRAFITLQAARPARLFLQF